MSTEKFEINMKKSTASSFRVKNQKIGSIAVNLFILFGCLIMVYPLLWMFSSSFKEESEIFSDTSLWPSPFTLENYINGWKGVSGVTFGTFF